MQQHRVVLQFQKGASDKAVFETTLTKPIKGVMAVQVEQVTVYGVANSSGVPTTKLLGIDLGLSPPVETASNKKVSAIGAATITHENNTTKMWPLMIGYCPQGVYDVRFEQPETREIVCHDTVVEKLDVRFGDETIGASSQSAPQFTDIYIILTFFTHGELETKGPSKAYADVQEAVQAKTDALNFIGYNL